MLRPKAFVLGSNFNALSIIQELSRHGVPCVSLDYSRNVCGYSLYCKFKYVPNPLVDRLNFERVFLTHIARESVHPVIIPTDDAWAQSLSEMLERLKDPKRACVADSKSIKLLLDKSEFYRFSGERNFTTPKTFSVAELRMQQGPAFPIVAKPRQRANPLLPADADIMCRLFNENRFTILQNYEEFLAFEDRQRDHLDFFIFQEYVSGDSSTMYTLGAFVDRTHKIVAKFTGHKVRGYPADSGDCIVGESCDLSEDILELSQRVALATNFFGIAEFEFKRDAMNGRFYLIEVNPRAWSWIGITPKCGVNLPLIAYKYCAGEAYGELLRPQSREQYRFVKLFQDAENVLVRYHFEYQQWAKGPWTWVMSFRWRQTIIAEFNRFDPLVMIRSFVVRLLSVSKWGLTRWKDC